MKLNDLEVGDIFILVRSGDKYIKGEKYTYEGSPTKRFLVEQLAGKKSVLSQKFPCSLSLQCKVKKVVRC